MLDRHGRTRDKREVSLEQISLHYFENRDHITTITALLEFIVSETLQNDSAARTFKVEGLRPVLIIFTKAEEVGI